MGLWKKETQFETLRSPLTAQYFEGKEYVNKLVTVTAR